MKRFIISSIFVLLFSPSGFAVERSLLARVTVYWAGGGGGSDHWTRQHKCATGARLRTGHCAVDPRRIPYGSKVVLPDGALVAVDTGSAVRNRKAARYSGRTASERNALVIDRFFETKRQAMTWANRNPQFMTVRVDSPTALAMQRGPQLATRDQPIALQPNPTMKSVTKTASTAPISARLASNQMIVRSPFNKLGK